MEFFDRQVFQSLCEDLEDIARPAHGGAFLSFLRRHSPSQFQRGMDTNSTSRSYAPNAGERGDGLRRQQPQRAAAARQNFLADAQRRPAFGTAS